MDSGVESTLPHLVGGGCKADIEITKPCNTDEDNNVDKGYNMNDGTDCEYGNEIFAPWSPPTLVDSENSDCSTMNVIEADNGSVSDIQL